MERSDILTAMSELKLYGMKAAFDEIITTAVKRQHEPQRIVGDLLTAEITEKQARSIRYQIAIAKLPLAKDIDDFRRDHSPADHLLNRNVDFGLRLAASRFTLNQSCAYRLEESNLITNTPSIRGCGRQRISLG